MWAVSYQPLERGPWVPLPDLYATSSENAWQKFSVWRAFNSIVYNAVTVFDMRS